jgi:hypothetical protein
MHKNPVARCIFYLVVLPMVPIKSVFIVDSWRESTPNSHVFP